MNEIEHAFKVARKMIAEFESKYLKAISDEDWRKAADLSVYINGMSQILIVFELACKQEGQEQ